MLVLPIVKLNQILRLLLVGLFSLSIASAQQKGKRGGGTFGFGNSLVTIASVEAVQKDLGVSGDVTSKLNSLRDDLNAGRESRIPGAEKIGRQYVIWKRPFDAWRNGEGRRAAA